MSSTKYSERQQLNELPEKHSFLHNKIVGDDGLNNVKTPRRGLGLIVNSTKTPVQSKIFGSSQQFATQKSATKKQVCEDFVVFEDQFDDEEPELKNLEKVEDVNQLESIKLGKSPIERASRISLGHDSINMGIEEEFVNQDFIELENDSRECFKNEKLNFLAEEDEEEEAQLGNYKWDGSPIEIASRIENSVDDFRDDAPIENVILFDDHENDRIQMFNEEQLGYFRNVCQISSFDDFDIEFDEIDNFEVPNNPAI